MTRIGRLGGNASRPLAIVLTLVVGCTIAYGPLGPVSSVALGASPTNAPVSSTVPGPASTAPGTLLGPAAPTDSPLPSDSPAPTDTAAPSPSDNPTPAPTDTAAPSPSPSNAPAPSPLPSSAPRPSPSSAPLSAGVVDEMGGTVVLGNVTVDVPPGAVSMRTRFFLGTGHGPDYAGIPPVQTFALHTKQLDTGGETDRFGVPFRLTIDTSGLDLSDLDLSTLCIVRLADGGTWDVLPTQPSNDALSTTSDRIGTFGVVARPAAPSVDVSITTDAPAAGRHRVDPGSVVQLTVSADAAGPMLAPVLRLSVPSDWTVTDADGATVDPATGDLVWNADAIGAAASVTRHVVLHAPAIAADAQTYEYTGAFGARVSQRRAPEYRAVAASILVAPRIVIQHRILGRVDPRTHEVAYGSADAGLGDAAKFQVMRVRFRIANPDSVPVTVAPLLQYLDAATPAVLVPVPGIIPPSITGGATQTWVTLPAASERLDTHQLYVATESADYAVRSLPLTADDTRLGGAGVAGIAPGSGMMVAAASGGFVPGELSQGLNPAPDVTLTPDGWTEVEFSVRATVWADWSAAYDLRLTDGATPIDPSVAATVTMQANPEPGDAPGLVPVTRQSYALSLISAAATVTPVMMRAAAGSSPVCPPGIVHCDTSLTTDSCAFCHRTHTAPEAYLLKTQGAQPQGAAVPGVFAAAADGASSPASAMCLVCHNGTGARTNVQAQYAAAPANDPATGSVYSHDTTSADGTHTDAHIEEFKGVLNRHSGCTDCHNPHSPTLAADTPSTQTPAGWTASSRESHQTGVAVTNGAAGTSPTYGFLDTLVASTGLGRLTYEYQLCLKCHSGYTTLPAPDPLHPSRWALDKGLEFNPANVSYHPVEAKGANASTYIDCSLSGGCPGLGETNPYRLWSTFTSQSTIRCTQCHGSITPGTKPDPGSDLQGHASPNRGLLLQPYRDRELKTYLDDTTSSPALGQFALCFSCHSTAPFTAVVGNRRPDTAFGIHGNHTAALATGMNPGTCTDTDIDHATGVGTDGRTCADGKGAALGAGSGNAICSECHFRTHSTVSKVGDQGTYTGLVNFAPDVTGVDGKPLGLNAWLKDPIDPQGGSCTLTCHGKVHVDVKY